MEHFLIFLSLQKPVNRLSLYYYYFFNVEGKDNLRSHFNFRASQISFIDFSYHRGRGGQGRPHVLFSYFSLSASTTFFLTVFFQPIFNIEILHNSLLFHIIPTLPPLPIVSCLLNLSRPLISQAPTLCPLPPSSNFINGTRLIQLSTCNHCVRTLPKAESSVWDLKPAA